MRNWLHALKLATFAAVVGLVLWLSDIHEIYAVILRSNIGAITASLALSVIAVALNALKWRLITPKFSVVELFKAAMIGQFYSFFFLGQASGEAAKIYLISRGSGNVSGATVSVFADRLVSFIGLLTVSVIGFAMSKASYPAELQRVAVLGLVLLVSILFALRHDAFFTYAERAASWLEGRTQRYSAAFATALRQAIEQWHVSTRNLWRIMGGLSIGALVHITNVVTFMILAHGIAINISFFDWCWIAGLTSVAGLIPITIGQITSGGALVALIHLQNVPLTDSLALSVLIIFVNCMLALIGCLLEWRRLQLQPTPPAKWLDGI